MFATQHYMEMGPDHKKRAHDDLADEGARDEEHRNKRLQSLPLRTPPRTAQQLSPSEPLEPLDPRSDAQMRSRFPGWPSPSPAAPQQGEVEMMDAVKSSHLQVSQVYSDADPRGVSGRMPTPIQPSFAAQVRGQNNEWAGPNGVNNHGHHHNGFDETTPRSMTTETDWHAVHSNRRLPSPISESGDSASGMMHDGAQNLSNQLQNSSISSHSPQNMEHPNAMDMEPSQSADDADPNSPSPSRKGHARSKHTVNSWTWQPGMKRSFSIGYRSDCEKCRLKVPGHFNHIIVS